jgi:hypothetical protein
MGIDPQRATAKGLGESGQSSRGPRLLGVPVGEFGLFASALLAVSLGLAGFCGSCFVAILSILIYNTAGHHAIDYADSYRYIALPAGIAALLVSGLVLAVLWVRRKVRG